jgi:hypothetical protein
MTRYKLINNYETNTAEVIHDKDNNKFIPFDPANTDYQKYLEWVAEGNTPEPADEVTE